jgi:NAD(P)-dependent dehydrogenase (short-subunit alcohol dehydrogenase family)
MSDPYTDLTGSVALVTGASAGIGAAIAKALATRGANLMLLARRAEALQVVAGEVRAMGVEATTAVADVTDPAALQLAVADALARFGRIDALVNNAGVVEPIASPHQADPAAWARCVEINLTGVFNACHAVLPHMLGRGAGVIVNISSGAATRALEGWSAYCAAKAGAAMFTQSLAAEYAARGLRCYGFVPGTVDTDMQVLIRASGINPVSRLRRETLLPPELPARCVAWLCSPAAADLPAGEQSIRDPSLRARVGLPEREAW